MNFKFFLTIALSFGCVVMLFMWYTANGIFKDSLLYEKQYLFKISTLESENKMELKLINSLRIDISKNDEDLKIKINLLESMRNKEKTRDEEREKLQTQIANIKTRYETVNKENNIWMDNWKLESQNRSESEKTKIKQLEDELDLLKAEYNRLKIAVPPTKEVPKKKPNDDDQQRQAKAPLINKDKLAESKDTSLKKVPDDDQHRQGKAPVLGNKKIPEENVVATNIQSVKAVNKKVSPNNVDEAEKGHDSIAEKNADKDKEQKIPKTKNNDKPAGDDQLKQPKFPPRNLKTDDNKEMKQFIQDKEYAQAANRNLNSKIHRAIIKKKVGSDKDKAIIEKPSKDKVQESK